MDARIHYQFTASVWQHPAEGGWYFVSLPREMATEIRTHFKTEEEGWGRLKVRAKVAKTEWSTAIWFDTKRNTYLLPIKAEVRKKQKIEAGDGLEISLWV